MHKQLLITDKDKVQLY